MLTIRVDVHNHQDGLAEGQMAELRRALRILDQHHHRLEKLIMATSAELTATLEAMATRAEKVKAEVMAALAVIGNGNTTPEQDAALARIEAVLGGLDDLTVDPVVEPPPLVP